MNYIDYDEEAHENEPPSRWNSTNLGTFWKSRWHGKFGAYPQWRIRETALLSKLLKRYSAEQLVEMIDFYFDTERNGWAFTVFYAKADSIYAKLNEPRSGYQW